MRACVRVNVHISVHPSVQERAGLFLCTAATCARGEPDSMSSCMEVFLFLHLPCVCFSFPAGVSVSSRPARRDITC